MYLHCLGYFRAHQLDTTNIYTTYSVLHKTHQFYERTTYKMSIEISFIEFV